MLLNFVGHDLKKGSNTIGIIEIYTYIRVFNISCFVSFDQVDTNEMIQHQTINQWSNEKIFVLFA